MLQRRSFWMLCCIWRKSRKGLFIKCLVQLEKNLKNDHNELSKRGEIAWKQISSA